MPVVALLLIVVITLIIVAVISALNGIRRDIADIANTLRRMEAHAQPLPPNH